MTDTRVSSPGSSLPPVTNDVRRIGLGSAILTVVLVAFVVIVARGFLGSDNIDWSLVRSYLFDRRILDGVVNTLILTVVAMAVGCLLGLITTVLALSRNPVFRGIAWLYVWLFRGTPLLVQLIIWFNLGLIFPTLWIGIPGTDFGLGWETNEVMTGFVAAILGLGLNEGAVMAEVLRSGVKSVDSGQLDGAKALGLTSGQTFRRVVLPQAIRVIIPAFGNNVIYMLKNTALVSVIAGSDLMTSVQSIYSQNFKVIELLIVASIWYLVLTSVATLALGQFEAAMARRGWVSTTQTRTGARAAFARILRTGRRG
jgi:polar amino acid transport system permease protein